MQIKQMDENLRKIEELKNISSIEYKDLSTTKNNKYTVIPGFMVFYNGLNCLYLTAKDEYFLEFIKKLREVYIEEKDRVIKIDSFGNNHYMEIDDISKELLLNGKLDNIPNIYSFYSNKQGYDKSLLFIDQELKSILPIIKYNLQNTLSLFSITLNINNNINGYQNNYYMYGKKNDIPCIIPIYYLKEDYNSYRIEIGGLFDKTMSIVMNIRFKNDSLEINSRINDISFSNNLSYKFINDKLVEKQIVYINREVKLLKTNNVNTIDFPNNFKYLENHDMTWYNLPWNALYGVKKEINKLNDKETIDTEQIIYLDIKPKSFIMRDYLFKQYNNIINSSRFLLDNVVSQTIGYEDNNISFLETSFLDTNTNGYYKQHLGGKYFYHVSSKSLMDSTKEDYIPLNKMMGIFDKTDLLRKDKINKILRRH